MAKTRIILGIDEVGRGPWAGPLVVGAAILGETFTQTAEGKNVWDQLADSKQLTAKKRVELAPKIQKLATASTTGWVSSAELDRFGMSASLKLATRRAVKQVLATKIPFSEIIIDGTNNFLIDTPLANHVTVLKKADSLIKEVSAASIIAKVARDEYMTNLAATYPGYGFEKHMGYGTALHRTALENLGICPEHRQSFRPIQEIMTRTQPTVSHKDDNSTQDNSATRGKTAENAVRDYLVQQGHQIIAQNYRTKTCEIDLVSVHDDKIYFTEVKYSRNPAQETTALARITPQKQVQMRLAAETFIEQQPEYNTLQPLLAAASVHGASFSVETWLTLD